MSLGQHSGPCSAGVASHSISVNQIETSQPWVTNSQNPRTQDECSSQGAPSLEGCTLVAETLQGSSPGNRFQTWDVFLDASVDMSKVKPPWVETSQSHLEPAGVHEEGKGAGDQCLLSVYWLSPLSFIYSVDSVD